MPKRTIVFDTGTVPFLRNRILDAAYAAQFPGASFIPELNRLATDSKIEVVTADVFLQQSRSSSGVVVLSDGITRYTNELIRRGLAMKVIFSGESPNIIPWFYHRLEHIGARYDHAALFRGFHDRLGPSVQRQHFYWPCPSDQMIEGMSYSERRLLVMVAGNKQRYPFNPRRPLRSILGDGYRRVSWTYLIAVDPLLRFPDLYEVRLRALEHFGPSPDFRLFGKGWDRDQDRPTRVGRINFAVAPEPCGDKFGTMSAFRFGLCFENCAFPGYVTEKIFDAFLAGCVPVYHGAPDIGDFCWPECFLDARGFSSFRELEYALRNYSMTEWGRHRQAARDFLASPAFAQHRPGAFSKQLFEWLLA